VRNTTPISRRFLVNRRPAIIDIAVVRTSLRSLFLCAPLISELRATSTSPLVATQRAAPRRRGDVAIALRAQRKTCASIHCQHRI
jgi:hypothetical protein